ncbi:acyltransferase family protein [Microbacteriaceae bacterium VKM Ac-2855]|nr:acyltransferase family protein [Microbacteriaceae bacterium VKM Ac-2855]
MASTVKRTVRSAGVDTVRLMGIVAVVAGHVWFDRPAQLLLYTWHVPIFFVLTGYFWTPRRPLAEEVRKRFTTLAVPYLAWLVLLSVPFVPSLILDGASPQDLFGILLGGSYVGRPYSAFWFVSALFFTAVVFRMLQRLPFAVQVAVAVALLLFSYLAPDVMRAVPLGIGTGLGSLVFVVAGIGLRRVRTRIVAPALVGAGSLVIAAVLVLLGLSAPLDLKQADFGTPLVSVVVAIMISAGLILVAERCVPALGAGIGTAIIALASCGLMVILSHAGILWLLRMREDGNTLYFLAALLIPWVVAVLIRRTRLAPFLLGVPATSSASIRRPPRPGRPH